MRETRESNIKYIRAKLPYMVSEDLELLAGIVRGFGAIGFSLQEYERPVLSQEQQRQADLSINTQ